VIVTTDVLEVSIIYLKILGVVEHPFEVDGGRGKVGADDAVNVF
jgi:hypothetical protein